MLPLQLFLFYFTLMISQGAVPPSQAPALLYNASISLVNFILPRTCRPTLANPKRASSLTYNAVTYHYHIPNTSRDLFMYVDDDTPLNPSSYDYVVSTTRPRVQIHIATHGDGLLWPRDSPTSSSVRDCYLQLEVGPIPGSPLVTYGMVGELMDAL